MTIVSTQFCNELDVPYDQNAYIRKELLCNMRQNCSVTIVA